MSKQKTDCDSVTESDSQAAADLDLEMALLAVLASRDMGEATEPVRLDTLSPIEKEVLLQLIRGKLGLSESSGSSTTEQMTQSKIGLLNAESEVVASRVGDDDDKHR